MLSPRKMVLSLLLVGAAVGGLTGCSRPEENAPMRVTGAKSAAIPDTTTTTSTTTAAPTTTLYFQNN